MREQKRLGDLRIRTLNQLRRLLEKHNLRPGCSVQPLRAVHCGEVGLPVSPRPAAGVQWLKRNSPGAAPDGSARRPPMPNSKFVGHQWAAE